MPQAYVFAAGATPNEITSANESIPRPISELSLTTVGYPAAESNGRCAATKSRCPLARLAIKPS